MCTANICIMNKNENPPKDKTEDYTNYEIRRAKKTFWIEWRGQLGNSL